MLRAGHHIYQDYGHYLQLLEQIALRVIALFALLGLLELLLGRVSVHGTYLKQAVCRGGGRREGEVSLDVNTTTYQADT